jgi:hypothetical protein
MRDLALFMLSWGAPAGQLAVGLTAELRFNSYSALEICCGAPACGIRFELKEGRARRRQLMSGTRERIGTTLLWATVHTPRGNHRKVSRVTRVPYIQPRGPNRSMSGHGREPV